MCELLDDADLMELETFWNESHFPISQSEDTDTDVDEKLFNGHFLNSQFEEDGTFMYEEPHETNYLDQNKKYQEQLYSALEDLQDALYQNRSRQNQIDEELLDLPINVEADTPQRHVSISKKSLTVFCAPYFKDHKLYSHPKNQDTIKKEENKELDVFTSNPAKWTDSERTRLKLKVRENALMKNKEYNEWMRAKQILIEHKNKSKLSDEEKQDLTIQITWADDEAKKIAELIEDHLFDNKEEDFDWDKISLEGFPRVHSAKSCELQWKNCIHPSWNQTAWNQNEDELLMVLADITQGTDWDFIADHLETERSPISCMQRLMRKLNKADSKRSWDIDEDESLVKLVREHRINNLIPWSTIACHMERRRKEQCWQRYICSLREGITRGTFSEKEDMLLLAAVEMHGEDWVNIGSHFSGRTPVQLFSRWKGFLKEDFRNWTREEDEELMELVEKQGENNWREISRKMSSGDRLFSNIQVRQRYTTIKAKYEKLDGSQGQPRLRYKEAPGLSSLRQNEIYKKTRKEYDDWSKNYEKDTELQEENECMDLDKDSKRGFLGLFNDVGNQKLESFMRHVQGLVALSTENNKEKQILEKSSERFNACNFEMPSLTKEEAYQMSLASECISKIGDFPILHAIPSDCAKETGCKKNNSYGHDNFEQYVSNQEIGTDEINSNSDIMDNFEVNRSSTKETTQKINPRWRRFGQLATCGDLYEDQTDDNPEKNEAQTTNDPEKPDAQTTNNPKKPIKMTLIPPNRATLGGYRELLLNHMRFENLTLTEFLKETSVNKPVNKKSVCDAMSSEEADDLLSRRFVQLFLLPAKMAVIKPRLSISRVVAPVSEPVLANLVVEQVTDPGLSNKEMVASVNEPKLSNIKVYAPANKPELSNGKVVAPAQVPTTDSLVPQSWIANIAMSNGKPHAPAQVTAADSMVSQSWRAKIAMSNGNYLPNKMSVAAEPMMPVREEYFSDEMSVAEELMMPVREHDLSDEMSVAEMSTLNVGRTDPIKLLVAKTAESDRVNDNPDPNSAAKNGVSVNANYLPLLGQVPTAQGLVAKTVSSHIRVIPFQGATSEPVIDPTDVLVSKTTVSNKGGEIPAQELETKPVVTNNEVNVSTQVLDAKPELTNVELPLPFQKRKYLSFK